MRQHVARLISDARQLPLAGNSVDLCLSSPPYWKKRRYGHKLEIGHEKTPEAHAEAMRTVLREIRRVLKPTGSLFLNLGDTYYKRSLAGIPHLVEAVAREDGWRIRNRLVWVKPSGVPSPHGDRLANRHEVVVHLTGDGPYFYDLNALAELQRTRFPGGDVWEIPPERNHGTHPAAFPSELAGRVIALACPSSVCRRCGYPKMPISGRSMDLDPTRPQAQRALALFRKHGLTARHLAAIRATGISDAGKARRMQTGTNRNSLKTTKLAREAKQILGGYFREFTFARRVTIGYQSCRCQKGFQPGLVIDVFAGTGTTLQTAATMNRRAIGIDLIAWGSKTLSPQKKSKRRTLKRAKLETRKKASSTVRNKSRSKAEHQQTLGARGRSRRNNRKADR